ASEMTAQVRIIGQEGEELMNMFHNRQSRSAKLKARSYGACSALALAGALIVASPLHAQQTSQPAAGPASSTAGNIDDIIVTARKRDERLQDVPATISAFTGEDLASRGTGSILQVAERTPQLIIATTATPSG